MVDVRVDCAGCGSKQGIIRGAFDEEYLNVLSNWFFFIHLNGGLDVITFIFK